MIDQAMIHTVELTAIVCFAFGVAFGQVFESLRSHIRTYIRVRNLKKKLGGYLND